jgi:hypothetical protein
LIVWAASLSENERNTMPEDPVTLSAPLPERNTCSECGGSLAGRKKNAATCSTKCRVALHRRLARQGVRDATGAVIAVADRVFARELEEQQRAAREKKRKEHQERRAQLREQYRAASAAMRGELPKSDAEIANEFEQHITEQADAGTLGIALAVQDRRTNAN